MQSRTIIIDDPVRRPISKKEHDAILDKLCSLKAMQDVNVKSYFKAKLPTIADFMMKKTP